MLNEQRGIAAYIQDPTADQFFTRNFVLLSMRPMIFNVLKVLIPRPEVHATNRMTCI